MTESERITVEEWAGEHSLTVTDDQIEELINALDVAHENYMEQFRKPIGYKTESDLEIESLKKKINMLERFISSKGHSISTRDSKIVEYQQDRISSSHYATNNINHYY